MKTRELIRLAESKGWVLDHTKGSHSYFRHPTLPGILCIPQSPGNHEMKTGTYNRALKIIKEGHRPGWY